jgi:hypothetical protein
MRGGSDVACGPADPDPGASRAKRQALAMFGQWQPPAGVEFTGFYGFADGSGGVAIIEADSAATIACTTAP